MPKKPQKFRRTPAARPNKAAEVEYRKALLAVIAQINGMVKSKILPMLKQNRPTLDYVADGVIADLTEQFSEIQDAIRFDEKGNAVKSAEMVNKISATSTVRAESALRSAGFILPTNARIIASQGLETALEAATAENAMLITRMSQEYLDKIKRAVLENYTTGKFIGKGGVIKEIQRISSVTKKRAKLIARDQSNKIHGAVTKERSKAAGSIGYQWRTAKDERVRGNPSGKYPDVKKSRDHWAREGKFLSLGAVEQSAYCAGRKAVPTAPQDGAPGLPINCRCVAAPVFPIGDELIF